MNGAPGPPVWRARWREAGGGAIGTRGETLALWGAVVLLSLFKMRGYALHGRFWAEEGRDFFRDIAGLPGADGLFYVFNHHLELWTNFVVWCATQVPLLYAPLVTCWLSWLFQLIPIAVVIGFRRHFGLTFARALLFVLAAAALPQSAEVWANSINLHFHFALLAALIAVVPPQRGRQAWILRLLLGAAGLSGIPANSLLPLFVVLAAAGRVRERRIQAGILAATTVLQLTLLAIGGFDLQGRGVATSPLVLWLAVLAQHLVSPLAGTKLAGYAIAQFNLLASRTPSTWAMAIALTVVYLLLWVVVVRRRLGASACFLSAGLLLAVFCVLTSLGNRTVLVSVDAGGRYFYAPNLLLLLGLLNLNLRPWSSRWRSVVAVWVLLSLYGLRVYLPGPAWPEALARAQRERSTEIAIWPNGWKMERPGAGAVAPRHGRSSGRSLPR